jgi:hypothetical protein
VHSAVGLRAGERPFAAQAATTPSAPPGRTGSGDSHARGFRRAASAPPGLTYCFAFPTLRHDSFLLARSCRHFILRRFVEQPSHGLPETPQSSIQWDRVRREQLFVFENKISSSKNGTVSCSWTTISPLNVLCLRASSACRAVQALRGLPIRDQRHRGLPRWTLLLLARRSFSLMGDAGS